MIDSYSVPINATQYGKDIQSLDLDKKHNNVIRSIGYEGKNTNILEHYAKQLTTNGGHYGHIYVPNFIYDTDDGSYESRDSWWIADDDSLGDSEFLLTTDSTTADYTTMATLNSVAIALEKKSSDSVYSGGDESGDSDVVMYSTMSFTFNSLNTVQYVKKKTLNSDGYYVSNIETTDDSSGCLVTKALVLKYTIPDSNLPTCLDNAMVGNVRECNGELS